MVKACQERKAAFRSSKYSLISYRPLTSCDYRILLIPIKDWATQNNYSYKQARNLIKKKLLMAKKYKNRWYVAATSDFNDELM